MSKITLEQLAEMIANGFNDVQQSFEKVDQRFEQVGQRFERMELRLDQMTPNFDVKDLNKRVTKIETHLGVA